MWKRALSPYAGLDRSVYILFFARVINCIGNFVFPFIAIYLTRLIGMSEARAGFFVMLTSLAAIPGMLLGGSFADKIGRKLVISVSMGLSAFCLVPCAFLGASEMIPWLLVLSVFFNSMPHAAINAMIADLVPCGRRNAAFALIYLGINIGTAIGPLIAGFLFNDLTAVLFLGDAATTILSVVLILFCVKESKPNAEDVLACNEELNADERAERGNTFLLLLRKPYVLTFTLITAVLTFVYSQHSFSLPIFSNSLLGEDGPKVFGVLMTVNCIVVLLLTTLVMSLTSRIKPVLNAALAAVFYAAGFGMLFFVRNYYLLLVSTIIWSIGEILATTNFQAYVADHSPITHRGRFNAVVHFITRGGFAMGPVVMGWVITARGVSTVWPVTALLALFCAAAMVALYTLENLKYRKKAGKPGGECCTKGTLQ